MKKLAASYTLGWIYIYIIAVFMLIYDWAPDIETILRKIKIFSIGILDISTMVFLILPIIIILSNVVAVTISKNVFFTKVIERISKKVSKFVDPEQFIIFIFTYFIPLALLALFTSLTLDAIVASILIYGLLVLSGCTILYLDKINKKWLENVLSILLIICFISSIFIFFVLYN